MCFDSGEWRERAQTTKHIIRSECSREEIVAKSRRRSLYFCDVDVPKIEKEAADSGIYLTSNGTNTIHKIHEFLEPIGASEGEASRWVLVESTSGSSHGYPITEIAYQRWRKETRECCT